MDCPKYHSALSADLVSALERKGYENLTSVQLAVLEPELDGADLRITSITGSGKTLAIGFVLRNIVGQTGAATGPRAIIIVPTRELAKQLQAELRWLFAERALGIASVTGGTSIRDERRALAMSPAIIIGTPGRLLDHLHRGAIVTQHVAAVVLDEADRMLDMGFRDDLHSILETLPKDRQTHLASATFGNEVGLLANNYQRNAVHVQGTRLGEVNSDIDHIVHIVKPGEKFDAIVNILLANPDEQSIIFARTRADVAAMTRELGQAGFPVVSLSGEMEQAARDRALATFRRGATRALVATDVAARGLDIQGVNRIIHVEPPSDPDSYVHRSGRTGRAGRKGVSTLLVAPSGVGYVTTLLRRAGIKPRIMPIPTAQNILDARDERLFAELHAPATESKPPSNPRFSALAARLCAEGNPVDLVSRLLSRADTAGIPPRDVCSPPVEARPGRQNLGKSKYGQQSNADAARYRPVPKRPGSIPPPNVWSPRALAALESPRNQKSLQRHADPTDIQEGYGAFHVTWGENQGADARRLLAIICRRGRIRSNDVGSIRIGPKSSVVEIRLHATEAFAKAAKAPDRRDSRVIIAPLRPSGPKFAGS